MPVPVPDTKIFEQDRIHPLLLKEAVRGVEDLATGRTKDAREAILAIKNRLRQAFEQPSKPQERPSAS